MTPRRATASKLLGRSPWLLLVVAACAWSADVRLLLSVGSNFGRPDEAPLQFAEQDAARVRDVFVELGEVAPSRALVLTRPTATLVRERFAELQGRVAELHAQGRSVELVVFVSAHGKAGLVHLTGTDLGLEELRALAKQTAADLSLVIVDACESGVALKGAKKGPAWEVHLERAQVKGEIFIASSGSQESSQEWGPLGSSLFTHHLLTALRGDADFDGDGRVTVMEAYSYAERRTVAQSIDVGQHPQFDLGVAGGSDVVLTELKRGGAQVLFDDTLEGRFVVVSQPRPDIVAEVVKRRGQAVRLAVPPGRYLVRQTQGFKVALQELELPWGGTSLVDARRFVVRDFAEVAMKGSVPEFHVNAVRVTAGGLTPTIEGTPLRWSVGAAWRLGLGNLWLSAGLAAGAARYRGVGLTTSELRGALRVSAGPRFWVGPLVVVPALAVELSLTRQTFLRDQEAAIRQVYGPLAPRLAWGGAVGPQVFGELPLVGPVFATASVTGQVRLLPTEAPQPLEEGRATLGPGDWTVGLDAELGVGVRF